MKGLLPPPPLLLLLPQLRCEIWTRKFREWVGGEVRSSGVKTIRTVSTRENAQKDPIDLEFTPVRVDRP